MKTLFNYHLLDDEAEEQAEWLALPTRLVSDRGENYPKILTPLFMFP